MEYVCNGIHHAATPRGACYNAESHVHFHTPYCCHTFGRCVRYFFFNTLCLDLLECACLRARERERERAEQEM